MGADFSCVIRCDICLSDQVRFRLVDDEDDGAEHHFCGPCGLDLHSPSECEDYAAPPEPAP